MNGTMDCDMALLKWLPEKQVTRPYDHVQASNAIVPKNWYLFVCNSTTYEPIDGAVAVVYKPSKSEAVALTE